ncbi:MAG: hypothetical protein H6Q86_4664 [candidate division NC10 bacterium]|nr:hypothetical protein [candidate division NC10 bacterium]
MWVVPKPLWRLEVRGHDRGIATQRERAYML